MDHWKNGSEKNTSLRDLVLEEAVENQMDGKGEKLEGTQKNRRRKDSMKHYTPMKNKVGWTAVTVHISLL
jgi:hypothetical protein